MTLKRQLHLMIWQTQIGNKMDANKFKERAKIAENGPHIKRKS